MNFVFKAARSSNGRTSPSGGEYLGSSPSLAALNRKSQKIKLNINIFTKIL